MKLLSAFAPALVWALVILALGSVPSLPAPAIDLPVDKVGHFGIFAVLGALLAWGAHRAAFHMSLGWPVAVAALVGALDELHQRSVPGRSSEWQDLLADLLGCVAGLYATRRALQWRAARSGASPGRDDDAYAEADRDATEPNRRQEYRAR